MSITLQEAVLPEQFPLSRVEWLRADGNNTLDHPCDVLIRPGGLVVTYLWQGVTCEVIGKEITPGHYSIVANQLGIQASLHRFETAKLFVGVWREGVWNYLWKVTIGD